MRDVVGVLPGVPLVVYGGGVNPARGLHTMVQALPALPGVYFAIVSRGNSVTEELLKLAGQLGVSERVRLAPYVDPEFVPRYLESASVGISPLPCPEPRHCHHQQVLRIHRSWPADRDE